MVCCMSSLNPPGAPGRPREALYHSPYTLAWCGQVDQAQLETVLPAAGGAVLVLAGRHRGADAEMLAVEPQAFQVRVRLRGGPDAGAELRLDYEDVCKLAAQ